MISCADIVPTIVSPVKVVTNRQLYRSKVMAIWPAYSGKGNEKRADISIGIRQNVRLFSVFINCANQKRMQMPRSFRKCPPQRSHCSSIWKWRTISSLSYATACVLIHSFITVRISSRFESNFMCNELVSRGVSEFPSKPCNIGLNWCLKKTTHADVQNANRKEWKKEKKEINCSALCACNAITAPQTHQESRRADKRNETTLKKECDMQRKSCNAFQRTIGDSAFQWQLHTHTHTRLYANCRLTWIQRASRIQK